MVKVSTIRALQMCGIFLRVGERNSRRRSPNNVKTFSSLYVDPAVVPQLQTKATKRASHRRFVDKKLFALTRCTWSSKGKPKLCQLKLPSRLKRWSQRQGERNVRLVKRMTWIFFPRPSPNTVTEKTLQSEIFEYYDDQTGEKLGAVKYWMDSRKRYLLPAKLARRVVSAPATFAKSDRVFSCSGLIMSTRQSNLLDVSLERLTFLRVQKALLPPLITSGCWAPFFLHSTYEFGEGFDDLLAWKYLIFWL